MSRPTHKGSNKIGDALSTGAAVVALCGTISGCGLSDSIRSAAGSHVPAFSASDEFTPTPGDVDGMENHIRNNMRLADSDTTPAVAGDRFAKLYCPMTSVLEQMTNAQRAEFYSKTTELSDEIRTSLKAKYPERGPSVNAEYDLSYMEHADGKLVSGDPSGVTDGSGSAVIICTYKP